MQLTEKKPQHTPKRIVYRFGRHEVDGHRGLTQLLGSKGANLAEMAKMGLPIPPGITIPTDMCHVFYESKQQIPQELKTAVQKGMQFIEKEMALGFGDKQKPLLVSVRSGSPVSMPGMMDTVLNLGITETTLEGLIDQFKNPRFVYDAYRRLIQMFGNVVLGIPHESFEHILVEAKQQSDVTNDHELPADALKSTCKAYLDLITKSKQHFPQDPWEQLWLTIEAVFKSWHNARAVSYRKLNQIHENLGTAVNIQAMVFGNMGEDCATGVCFSRNPATGENKIYGEYLVNAQGEDVVAGIRTPHPLRAARATDKQSLQELMPKTFQELTKVLQQLEVDYKDMQDVEFTVQSGKLYVLQTRSGKRTTQAAIRIATDMVKEKILTKEEALLSVNCYQVEQLLHPQIHPDAKKETLAQGLAASPGVGSGQVALDAVTAKQWASESRKVILVRKETSPEDIEGMAAAQGILTAQGGMTSHAAVVARGMGKPCITGCSALFINPHEKWCEMNGVRFHEGDVISLDGTTGEVLKGEVKTIPATFDEHFDTFMAWADEARTLHIRANADTPQDAIRSRELGAEGIGLARTEHMFFDAERIQNFRKVILLDNREQVEAAIQELKKAQRQDFIDILRAMKGFPVTIRLLDPPLHEFLPKGRNEIDIFAHAIDKDEAWVTNRINKLEETNPMLGHRGARIGITIPEIYDMQVEAIIEAAIHLKKEEGQIVKPEIMVPLVFGVEELKQIRDHLEIAIQKTFKATQETVTYQIGTMIEIPRACLVAERIAEVADFFSFGTNDLTQMALGISRDDSAKFIPRYIELQLIPENPFISLDEEGVGQLMQMALERARAVPNRKLHYGICGEHGGDPQSIAFCHKLKLGFVSCSPFRIPVARLAAAQAALSK